MWTRELNPYFAGGGTGMPTSGGGDKQAAAGAAVGKGDGGVAWLTKVRHNSTFRLLFLSFPASSLLRVVDPDPTGSGMIHFGSGSEKLQEIY